MMEEEISRRYYQLSDALQELGNQAKRMFFKKIDNDKCIRLMTIIDNRCDYLEKNAEGIDKVETTMVISQARQLMKMMKKIIGAVN